MSNPFKKGHPGYYHGKKIDCEKFSEGFNQHMNGEINREEFAKKVGLSVMTLNKHLRKLFEDGEIKGIFHGENDTVTLQMNRG